MQEEEAGPRSYCYVFNNNGNDRYSPYCTLSDVAGNLYGVTYQGGTHNGGTLFEILP